MTATYDVLGIGNAIVDVLARADDEFVKLNRLAKGAMSLIDAERAEALYQAMRSAVECSGGSCANTMAGIASLGGKAAYIGKVRDDALGWTFAMTSAPRVSPSTRRPRPPGRRPRAA